MASCKDNGCVLRRTTGGAVSIRVAIDGARHRERRGSTGRQDRSGRAERRAGRPGRVVRVGLRDARAARGCVAWPADASASLACVLCSSVCLHVGKLHAVCVLLERERKEMVFAFAWTGKEEGSCFCKCRQEHVAGQWS